MADLRRVLARDAKTVAPALIGWTLHRRLDDGAMLAGRIIETEAYCGVEDAASHAFGGRRTERNASMYAAPGTAYVYFTYGMHWCFNVSCRAADDPQAVLIRALEPLDGAGRMLELRRTGPKAPAEIAERLLCAGPARLCRALAIDREFDGENLLSSQRLWLEGPKAGARNPSTIVAGPRIGIAGTGEPWVGASLRFAEAGHRGLSKPAGG
ncbi:MAG: DNA-3-methyladenine glycosylase [Planctomycetota bacterium]